MKRFATMAAVATLGLGASAMAEGDFVAAIDVSGWNDLTAADIDLGGGFKAEITGIGWDITLTAQNGGWFSDAEWSFAAQGAAPSLFLTPGAGVGESGTQFFTSEGIIKLADVGIPNIQLDNGVLSLSLNTFGWDVFAKEESFIYVQYNVIPAPGALALVGLAGLVSRRRRA